MADKQFPADIDGDIDSYVKKAGTSFYWGMRILPYPQRRAMYAIYAFCRIVDDIADGHIAKDKEQSLHQLELWRSQMDMVYKGSATTMLGRELSWAVSSFNLGKEEFLSIIEGMKMDCQENIIAPDMSSFELYCFRVAAAVGLLSIKVFGDDSKLARNFAISLGRALQVTNILRDLREDALRGRLYLPKEILNKYDISYNHPLETLSHPLFPMVFKEMIAMVDNKFLEVDELLLKLDRKKMRPALIMADFYRSILIKLKKKGFRLNSPAVSLGSFHKALIVCRQLI